MRAAAMMIAGLYALAAAPEAAAQLAKGARLALTGEEARGRLYGVDMSGFSPSFSMSWRECIEPDGETLYETPMGQQKGRMTVSDEGVVCFAYEDTQYRDQSCYTVTIGKNGLVFHGDLGGVFVATSIVTGVESCTPDNDLIS
jgi:hypothetical protein